MPHGRMAHPTGWSTSVHDSSQETADKNRPTSGPPRRNLEGKHIGHSGAPSHTLFDAISSQGWRAILECQEPKRLPFLFVIIVI